MAEDIMNLNLYELLGTVSAASVKEIKTAYRKKALSCHPDKNPDNPRAAELFHELKRALEILIDESARAAYDKVLNSRQQAKARLAQLDTKRRKFQEDLEAREDAYRRSQSVSSRSDEQKLKAEIERLKKEGSKQVEEEVEFVKKQIYDQLYGDKKNDDGLSNTRVKIKWKAAKGDAENGGYNHENLYQILSKHGDISVLVVSSVKKGRAMVEFKDKSAAVFAVQIETGYSSNPLSLQLLSDLDEKSKTVKKNSPSSPNIFGTQVSNKDYEDTVLANMRRAEERRKLIEQMQKEDEEEEKKNQTVES